MYLTLLGQQVALILIPSGLSHPPWKLQPLPEPLPTKTSYRDYFSGAETNTFCRRYNAFLVTYSVNPASTTAPADVKRLIYDKAQ